MPARGEPPTPNAPPNQTGGLPVAVVDLGRLNYRAAYERQVAEVERVIAQRETPGDRCVGVVLLVEHDPVITVSRRPSAAGHVLASAGQLAGAGVAVEETDRGGDVTYHGPGQLVVYPILDLNRLGLRLHEYMRLLEETVIRTCVAFGVATHRDADATGVWTQPARVGAPGERQAEAYGAKIAAMGVRVRRWVAMHGLALNIDPNLDHFRLIVPCGLAGRPVTSLREELAELCPKMETVKVTLCEVLTRLVEEAQESARARRAAGSGADE